MDKKRILFIGLEEADVQAIKAQLGFEYLVVNYYMLPRVKLQEGLLLVESPTTEGKYLPVDKVIFHGIFENDFDFITLLALWNGPCLPNAHAMMDLRSRIPGLVRTLQTTRFGALTRSMVLGAANWESDRMVVAKWGVWHCGDDKHKFEGGWMTPETALIEDFIAGEAVRIMMVSDRYWQLKLTGDGWLKSIHHADAAEMTPDPELVEDTRNIARHFNMQMVGVDYMIAATGEKYLLEVNHIPNVTVFPFVNEAFRVFATAWIKINK
jgi:hypothetical protein